MVCRTLLEILPIRYHWITVVYTRDICIVVCENTAM